MSSSPDPRSRSNSDEIEQCAVWFDLLDAVEREPDAVRRLRRIASATARGFRAGVDRHPTVRSL